MGPNTQSMEQVKRDAYRATIRHLRDEMEDNGFVPVIPLDQVERELLGNTVTLADDAIEVTVEDTPAPAAPKKGGK